MSSTVAPVCIETARLVLRPHGLDDFDGYAALWGGAPARDIPLQGFDAEQAWARLLRFIGHWQAFGWGPFVAVDVQTEAIVAEAGLAWFRRGLGGAFDRSPEAMWKVDGSHQGRGIASEAMLAIMRWFDAGQPDERTVCMIHETNVASMRVAEKLGYRRFGQAIHLGHEVLLFERLKGRHSQGLALA